MRELRAEVQTDIVTAVATSDRTELIRGHCVWEAFFLFQTSFASHSGVNSACRPTGVGVASGVQLLSQRTHRPPQPLTVWHEKTDCHVGKFVRASLPLRVWTSVHVRLGLRLCTCTSASARGGWCVGVFACMCVCLCVNRLREAVRAHAHASVCVCVCLRVRMRVHHVCARVCIMSTCACMCPWHGSLHVSVVWIMCASYELLVCACVRNNKHLRK